MQIIPGNTWASRQYQLCQLRLRTHLRETGLTTINSISPCVAELAWYKFFQLNLAITQAESLQRKCGFKFYCSLQLPTPRPFLKLKVNNFETTLMQKCGFYLKDAKYWRRQGASDIQRMLQMEKYQSQAKNVIIFIGDGMGIQTHAMARIYKVCILVYLIRYYFLRIIFIKISRQYQEILVLAAAIRSPSAWREGFESDEF